jgi:outer membrane lipoprotein LolB
MRVVGLVIFTSCLLLGCATPTPASLRPTDANWLQKEWQGRLSVTVMSTPPQTMSARFLLRGDAHTGTLDLYSPLGTTVGALQWSPQQVQLNDGKQLQYFESLADLTEKITGAALPMAAIFNWIEGKNEAIDGWRTDFTGAQQGALLAQRTMPSPQVTLRIKLD